MQAGRLIAAAASTLLACTGAWAGDADPAATRAGLDALVLRLAGDGSPERPQRNTVVRVHDSGSHFVYATAAGLARADAKDTMTPARPFYIASITKPMVAARILQLVEAGKLSLDTTLAQAGILPPDALAQLQVFEGRAYGPEITIRQLLQHRTGLRDMLLDDRQNISEQIESGIAPGSIGGIWSGQLERYQVCRAKPDSCSAGEMAGLYPGHRWKGWDGAAWQRNPKDRDAGLINFFLAEMGSAGLFVPGTAFHYADTNYILLGILIEKLGGRSLNAELREHVFRPLGMFDTWIAYAPEPEAKSRNLAPADFWVGPVPIVSQELDVSFDWAGGGAVTTADDLDRFLRGIVSGKLFRSQATRDEMIRGVPTPTRHGFSGGYGFGIRSMETDYGPMWGHMGAWGAVMSYFPKYDVSITGTVSRLFDDEAMKALVFDSMAALKANGMLKDARR